MKTLIPDFSPELDGFLFYFGQWFPSSLEGYVIDPAGAAPVLRPNLEPIFLPSLLVSLSVRFPSFFRRSWRRRDLLPLFLTPDTGLLLL